VGGARRARDRGEIGRGHGHCGGRGTVSLLRISGDLGRDWRRTLMGVRARIAALREHAGARVWPAGTPS
jgi:hypothetical protein